MEVPELGKSFTDVVDSFDRGRKPLCIERYYSMLKFMPMTHAQNLHLTLVNKMSKAIYKKYGLSSENFIIGLVLLLLYVLLVKF